MDNEEKLKLLNKLHIKRDEINQEIKKVKNAMTTEEFEKMMQERSEIDVGKC